MRKALHTVRGKDWGYCPERSHLSASYSLSRTSLFLTVFAPVCAPHHFSLSQLMDRKILRMSWQQVWSWWIPAFAPFRNQEYLTVENVSILATIIMCVCVRVCEGEIVSNIWCLFKLYLFYAVVKSQLQQKCHSNKIFQSKSIKMHKKYHFRFNFSYYPHITYIFIFKHLNRHFKPQNQNSCCCFQTTHLIGLYSQCLKSGDSLHRVQE